ncbi:hypothetical protein [Pseudomonas oryzicola]|uniref:Uncharacterized protein n=1 Tax=Pseudomonas oryzicola TaxID=485876 RepID=A0ABS6QBP1_9PSED|nr:hypothetical protein [Pseudomonas oryzicola]MBV4491612.1 hypothetical protein [Pseudomonas oryzicola]
MSVLNFPRIYMKGHMFWNPPTGNNNDMFPLYDAVNMEMNWRFLEHYNINRDNAGDLLANWMITPRALHEAPDYVTQAPPNAPSPSNPYPVMMPAEWDLFGDNGCGTVTYKETTSTIIGGELPTGGYVDSDPLIALPYNLYGNPFGSTNPSPARFVDVSPWQNTFTALYFDRLVLGNDTCGLTAKREYRMLDRFLNFNWGAFGGLNYVTTTWQTCFPKENLSWVVGDSALLKNLQAQLDQPGVQGLMFRFCTYLTFYDKNGVFNDQPPISAKSQNPVDMARVQELYQKGLSNPADIFFNPAYSCTSGVLGLWLDGEYPTAPAGVRLVPDVAIAVPAQYNQRPKTVQLGVVSAQVHGSILSLDLMNTIPFIPATPQAGQNPAIPTAEKLDFGSFDVGIDQGGTFVPVTHFTYADYQQSMFEQRSGIVDLLLSQTQQAQLTSGAPLALQQQATGINASKQAVWTAEVIQSGSFIDVGETRTLQIMVQKNGVPAKNTNLLVAEYNNPYLLGTSSYYLGFSNNPNFTLFKDFPANRMLNSEVLPQFVGAAEVDAVATEGAGRKLVGLRREATNDDGTDVMYQDYRKTPAGISLGACLILEGAKVETRYLQEPANEQVIYNYAQITTDDDGIANVIVTGKLPGFPTLRFFPNEDGQAEIAFSFTYLDAYVDFLAPLRVLPAEPDLQREFVEQWNQVYQKSDSGQLIWDSFIYPRIFEPYYYLYPIMGKYMPLNDLSRIEGAVDQLIRLISKAYQEESTVAMPITRDMPQSRRSVLELWAQKLVQLKYPPKPLSMDDYNHLKVN